jgi:hypothetical protein
VKEYRLPMYGRWALNADDSLEKVAEISAKLNAPEKLTEIINNPEAILRKKLPSGTDIVLLHPTGPYTDRALMLAMYNPDIKTTHNAQWTYDYPFKEQVEYWRFVVSGLYAQKEILKQEGRDKEVKSQYVENATHVSNGKFRTSSTISFQHGHFIEIDPKELVPTTHTIPHLREEREVLERGFLMKRFLRRLSNSFEMNSEVKSPDFIVQEKLPLGYGFKISSDNSDHNISKLTFIMNKHHKAYENLTQEYLDSAHVVSARFSDTTLNFRERLKTVIPPPSYRLYMTLNISQIDVEISPEFISHAGVMQGEGIDLDRNEDHEIRPLGTPEARCDYAQKFAGFIKHL